MQFLRPYLQPIPTRESLPILVGSTYIGRTATNILPSGSADTAASALFWRRYGCKPSWRPFWIDFRACGSQSRLRVLASGQIHSFILWNGFLYGIDRAAPRRVEHLRRLSAIADRHRPSAGRTNKDSHRLRGNAPNAPPIPAQGDRHRPVLDGAGDSPVLRAARRNVAARLGRK